ncbi:MAG: glycine dehydrogenase (aminomethyl-transferring), partial [Bacteroidetes bacterium HGW-Bacteroidetes-21]
MTDKFVNRHNGPRDNEIAGMLSVIGVSSLEELISKTVPGNIRLEKSLNLPEPIGEYEYLMRLKAIASENKIFKTYIGQGYYGTITPSVILRNILENPSWYTSYTPYQAEISQGRLEALLNFQTVIASLTKMDFANASLLDEATAGAEAMIMMYNSRTRDKVKDEANVLFVDENIFAQTLSVIKSRALPLGIEVKTGCFSTFTFDAKVFGAMVQYPGADGKIVDYKSWVETMHQNNILVSVAADILSLTLLTPPGEWGADIVFGSTQRFGIPMGFGGPHAAFFACRDAYKRNMPGRIIGVSVDRKGRTALRMALQTREQHIKREKATSNICTAQALLAIMAGMYAVYHGPDGLKEIAGRIHSVAALVGRKIQEFGYTQENKDFFDTLLVTIPDSVSMDKIRKIALDSQINLHYIDNKKLTVSIDEATLFPDIIMLLNVFAEAAGKEVGQILPNPGEKTFQSSFGR